MITVWKFPLSYLDQFDLEVPRGAEFIHFDFQAGIPTVWALVNSANSMQRRSLRMAGTGHELSAGHDYNHIGSCIDTNTGLVWHLFEEK
ncbi:hypothetical protein LCGC14_1131700 [marine sediment metagenome]|uniref:DUF7352 domain-containing protein n=1 Tax=marine sediment metagenome TaxID=412755 RepID=A0A0F9MNN9_9ZZZZ